MPKATADKTYTLEELNDLERSEVIEIASSLGLEFAKNAKTANLINNILDISKIEAGHIHLDLELHRPADFIEMAVEGIDTNIPLHRELMQDAAFIRGGTNIHYLEERLAKLVNAG